MPAQTSTPFALVHRLIEIDRFPVDHCTVARLHGIREDIDELPPVILVAPGEHEVIPRRADKSGFTPSCGNVVQHLQLEVATLPAQPLGRENWHSSSGTQRAALLAACHSVC